MITYVFPNNIGFIIYNKEPNNYCPELKELYKLKKLYPNIKPKYDGVFKCYSDSGIKWNIIDFR